jgi:triosephosphate isomerase
MAQLVIAYEPVWAIGTGLNATPEQAAEAHGHIRQRLRHWHGAEAAERCHVIYGGSVKPGNIREIVSQADVDGALVGGPAWISRDLWRSFHAAGQGGIIPSFNVWKDSTVLSCCDVLRHRVRRADAGDPAAAG